MTAACGVRKDEVSTVRQANPRCEKGLTTEERASGVRSWARIMLTLSVVRARTSRGRTLLNETRLLLRELMRSFARQPRS